MFTLCGASYSARRCRLWAALFGTGRRAASCGFCFALAIASSPPAIGQSPYGVDADTIGLWTFDQDSDDAVIDETGVHHGTAFGAAVITGRFGLAREFGYVEIPDHADLTNLTEFTVEFWFQPTALPTSTAYLVQKGGHFYHCGHNNSIFQVQALTAGVDEIQLRFQLGGLGGNANPFTGTELTRELALNQWYYVAATYDGSHARLYINGRLESASPEVPGIVVSSGENLYFNNHRFDDINCQFHYGGARMPGVIDEVRISDRARSAEEIAATHAGTTRTTVITHGFFPGDLDPFHELPKWVCIMAERIRTRAGGGRIFEYEKNTGLLVERPPDCDCDGDCGPTGAAGHDVVVLNWVEESALLDQGYSEAAAEAFFASLVRWGLPERRLDNLHLIGHSRGAVVNSEIAERLVAIGHEVDHVTTLDPHDWGGDFGGFGVCASDHDVNQDHPEYPQNLENPGTRAGVVTWGPRVGADSGGVQFADSYWQYDDSATGLSGRSLEGAANLNLSQLEIDHSDVHEWYSYTIPSEELPGTPPEWYSAAQNCPLAAVDRLVPLARSRDGYFFSKTGGGSSVVRCSPRGVSTPVRFNFFAREGLVNGDFERPGSLYGEIPGWQHHGGGGDGWWKKENDGDHFLHLIAGELRRHNRFLIVPDARFLRFCLRRITEVPNALLLVSVGTATEPDLLEEVALNLPPSPLCVPFSYELAEHHRGSVQTLTFQIIDDGSGMAEVGIDNVRISRCSHIDEEQTTVVPPQAVTGTASFRACGTLRLGDVDIDEDGQVNLSAGRGIEIGNGFFVAEGASLRCVVEDQ